MDGWDIMVRMIFPFSQPFPHLDFSMHSGRPLTHFWLPLARFRLTLGTFWFPFGSLWFPLAHCWHPFRGDYENFHKFHIFS